MNLFADIEKHTIDLLLTEPFYAHLLAKIIKSETSEKTSIDITLHDKTHIQLAINPAWWNDTLQTDQQKTGAIKHQVLHILFKHIFRAAQFSDKMRYGLAADLVVNQHLFPEQRYQGAIVPEDFPELELSPQQTLDYYYEKLPSFEPIALASHGYTDNGDPGEPAPQLMAMLNQYFSLDSAQKINAALKNLGKFLNDGQEISGSQKSMLDAEIDKWMLDAFERLNAKQQGTVPGHLRSYLLEIQKLYEEKIHWRHILKIFAESSSRTYLKNTLKQASKRYGTIPGTKIKKRNKLLVVIDTSGSINEEELKIFFSEIYHIWKKGAEIKILECDCAIGNIYPYRGKTPNSVQGGGGTDFNPPLEWANKMFHPDGIIYFTDGYAPILWLITASGITNEDDFWKEASGRKIKMV